MRSFTLPAIAVVFLISGILYGQEAGSGTSAAAAELLQRSDLTRAAWETFVNRTEIRNFEDGELKDVGQFEVSMKGDTRTLVRFLNPDVKGEYLLMLDDAMWIYMPNTRKPIRITPLQRLLGDASNGDVARTRYAADYEAKSMKEETLDGVQCAVLELAPKREGATYNRIEYWIGKADARPRKAEVYLASGKHYKTILYDRYGTVGDRVLLLQLTIFDRLREGRKTIMTFSDYAAKDIPEKYFNKDYLEKLK